MVRLPVLEGQLNRRSKRHRRYVTSDLQSMPLRPHRQLILHVLYAGGHPGRVLDCKLLGPVSNLAFRQDFIVVSNCDPYVPSFDF
jgi:hypothetical protein